MGFTFYFQTKESLNDKEVLGLIVELFDTVNKEIFRVDWLTSRKILINPKDNNIAVESFVVEFDDNGNMPFNFCKTNRYEPYTEEVRNMLTSIQKASNNKFIISDDDGWTV